MLRASLLARVYMRRGSGSIADQVLSSGTNFLFALVMARRLTPAEFGLASLFAAYFVICMSIVRGAVAEPFLVAWRQDRDDHSSARPTVEGAVVGVVLGVVGLAVGLGMRSPYAATLLVAATIPGLMSFEAARSTMVGTGSPKVPLLLDALWLLAALLALLLPGLHTLEWLLGAWLGTGAILGYALLVSNWLEILESSRHRTHEPRLPAWTRVSFAVDYLLGAVSIHAVLFVIAAAFGLSAAGEFRAVLLYFGPINLVFMGIRAPVLALLRPTSSLQITGWWISGLAASLVLVWALIGRWLDAQLAVVFGTVWAEAHGLYWPVAWYAVGSALASGPSITFRVAERGRTLLTYRLVQAGLGIIPLLVIGMFGLAAGIGIAVSALAAGLVAVAWLFRDPDVDREETSDA